MTTYTHGSYIQPVGNSDLYANPAAPVVAFDDHSTVAGYAGTAIAGPGTGYVVLDGTSSTRFVPGQIVQVTIWIYGAATYDIEASSNLEWTTASQSPSWTGSQTATPSAAAVVADVTFGSGNIWFSVSGQGYQANTNFDYAVIIDSIGFDANTADQWNASSNRMHPVVPPAVAPPRPFTTFNEPGATSGGSLMNGINNAGDRLFGFGNNLEGVLKVGSSTVAHVAAPAGSSDLFGFNNVGQFVGTYSGTTSVAGFISNGGTYTILQDPLANQTPSGGSFGPTNGTSALGINDLGQVVGAFTNFSGYLSAYFYQKGSFTTLAIPGAVSAEAVGVNNAGDIVGDYFDANGRSNGFLLHNGTYTTLEDPIGQNASTYVTGINNKGQIVGYATTVGYTLASGRVTNLSYNAIGGDIGFVYSSGTYTTINYPNAGGTTVNGINDAGRIVGAYEIANTSIGFYANVPLAREDLNGDHTGDILLRDSSQGGVSVWSLSNGLFGSSSQIGGMGSNLAIQGIGDFNSDGSADVLYRDTSTGGVSVWTVSKNAVTAATQIGGMGGNLQVMGVGDFNDDGTSDVLYRDATTGGVSVWTVHNDVVTAATQIGGMGGNLSIQGVGDFNGDGTSDVLYRDNTTGGISVWTVQNDVVTSATQIGGMGSNLQIVGVGDFNGDGTSDVLYRDNTTGGISAWSVTNNTVTAATQIGGVGSNISISSVGDYNGDGMSDILLRDNSSGGVTDWTISNNHLVSAVQIGGVGANIRIS